MSSPGGNVDHIIATGDDGEPVEITDDEHARLVLADPETVLIYLPLAPPQMPAD